MACVINRWYKFKMSDFVWSIYCVNVMREVHRGRAPWIARGWAMFEQAR